MINQVPKEMVKEFEELFPDYEYARQLIDENKPISFCSAILGSFSNAIKPDDVLAAISLEDLKEKAKLIKRKNVFESKCRELRRKLNESKRQSVS